MPRRVDGVFMITRGSTRLVNEQRQPRDGVRATQAVVRLGRGEVSGSQGRRLGPRVLMQGRRVVPSGPRDAHTY